MKMKVKLDEGAFMPVKEHETDAGYDLLTPYDFVVRPHDAVTVDTGVHMAIPEGYAGMIKSKSGLMVNYNNLCEGVIDSGYNGSIRAKLFNHGGQIVKFERGQKITQICIVPIANFELEQVDSLDATDRGTGGFGSTGR